MKAKPLIETNPYLKDEAMRRKLVARSVRTSCAVEGIKKPTGEPFIITNRKPKKIYQSDK